jgi:hypothetical protein
VLACRRPGSGFESSVRTASIHLDVYPQDREHSWDGYVCYIKVLISFHFHLKPFTAKTVCVCVCVCRHLS